MSFKRYRYFYPNSFKFCATKKDYKYLQIYWTEICNVIVKDFRKYEKLEYKKNKLKLGIEFLNNCKQLGVYPKFVIFKLPNVSNKDALSVRKRLLRSPINKRNKEHQHLSRELSLSVNVLSTQLSTTDFYILTKSITSYNKKSSYTQQKKLSSLTRDCNLPIFTANETITNLTQYELSQEESDLLKAGLYFSIQRDKIQKFKIFTTFEKIHRSFQPFVSATLNPRKIKVR